LTRKVVGVFVFSAASNPAVTGFTNVKQFDSKSNIKG
jgi:hypothetical protein